MMAQQFKVLVGFNHSVAFDRRAFIGLATLANERRDIMLMERLSDVAWADVVRGSGIQGLIVARLYGAIQQELNALGIPFVSLADRVDLASNEYVVAMDEDAIGAISAQHYLDAGFRHFGACMRPGLAVGFSGRLGGFVRTVKAAGYDCVVGPMTAEGATSQDGFEDETSWTADAAAWISALPKPLAVFAPYDYHARVVVNVAKQAGFRVPDDVAVIGVDDDDVYCMTTSPQLSSVVTPGRQVGQLALKTLIDVLQGKKDVPRRILVPPPMIMVRGSSSDSSVQDPDVIDAVRFIREHADRGVTVGQVADHVSLSRRTLERRFMQTLAHTIRDEIRRAKVNRAKQLLIDTDLPYAEVARRSGLLLQQQLNRVIKAATGKTPAEFRTTARRYRPL